MKKIRNLVLLLTLLVITSLVSYRVGEQSIQSENTKTGKLDLSMMWKVKDRLTEMYLDKDKINDDNMVYGAIQGMVASLDDPYTMFLTPKENESANEDLAGQFGGVGIQLGYKDKSLAVVAPLAKTPAEKAGLQAGDLILKIIDNENKVDRETDGMALDEAVSLIRGKIDTEVTLKIYRESKKDAFDVTLKRENIVVASSELVWREKNGKKVAWVRLYKFSDQLYTDWPKIVEEIKSKNADGIVLDLRNNPGGFLQSAVTVASDLVKEGVIVSQESFDGSVQKYSVDQSKGELLDKKMVVLVNGGSASAAEILAGALKDYGRAKLVGEKTFGKGTVQQPEDFSDGSGLHITIAKWLLPSGKNIHEVGVDPDVEVKYVADEKNPEADNQLDKAIEVLWEKQ